MFNIRSEVDKVNFLPRVIYLDTRNEIMMMKPITFQGAIQYVIIILYQLFVCTMYKTISEFWGIF